MEIETSRPLTFLDTETTGVDTKTDQIIEFYAKKFLVGKSEDEAEELHLFIRPTIPIPKEATEVHGIHIDDLKDKPTFPEVAEQIYNFLLGSDIAAYNVKFDLEMVCRQLAECGYILVDENLKLVDPMGIHRKYNPHDLASVYESFFARKLEGAHGAKTDTEATIMVFRYMLKLYNLTGWKIEDLQKESFRDKELAEPFGNFVWEGDDIVFGFGKHKGKIASSERSYLNWMMSDKADFPPSTKKFIKNVILK